MCGRTACTLGCDEFPKACRYTGKDGKTQEPQWRDGGKYFPSHNISPQSYTPVLVSSQHFIDGTSEALPERILQPMKWGLVPSWHRGDPKEFTYNMSNARSDTLLDKKSFKSPLEKGKRCVVLAEGFFEWQNLKGGKKQPYFIHFKSMEPKKGESIIQASQQKEFSDSEDVYVKKEDSAEARRTKRLLAMAGLFDHWKAPKDSSSEDKDLFSYTIITVDSTDTFKWLHHRMPAVLDGEEEIRQWLDYGEVPWKEAMNLVAPKDCLEWYPVSTVVNNSRNKSPDCIKPIDLSKQEKPAAGTLFSYFKRSPTKAEKSIIDELALAPKKTKFEQ